MCDEWQTIPPHLATVIGDQNAAIGLACYTLLLCGIALWAFQHQNLSNYSVWQAALQAGVG